MIFALLNGTPNVPSLSDVEAALPGALDCE